MVRLLAFKTYPKAIYAIDATRTYRGTLQVPAYSAPNSTDNAASSHNPYRVVAVDLLDLAIFELDGL